MNQQVQTNFADSTGIVTTYNDVQLMETITEVNGTTSYQYDEENRLTRIDYPTGNFIEYQYDKAGNRIQMTTPNHTVDYTFDVLNRMQTVTDGNGTTSYTYDAVGNRATQSNANGTVATYTYDQLNRLIDLTHRDSNNTVIASYAYTLGANGNRLSITEATGRVVDYQYDDTYRLLTETVTDPINGNHSSEWAYDAVGNRLQQLKDGVITTYVYDSNDRLLSETEGPQVTAYNYDDNGNNLAKAINGVVDSAYSYSKQNWMLEAVSPNGTIVNTYDAAGVRQSQSVNGTITHYLVDKNRPYAQVVEEHNDLFIPQTTYTYGDDLINQTNSQGTHTFGYDGLGSTRILTDASGTVQNVYGYEAFGEIDYQLGTLDNKYLFTGEQYDNNFGFYYLRARYYDPSNGRFTQMDTFPGMRFEPKTLHKYLYTHADPVNNIDPSGNITFNIGGLMEGFRNGVIALRYAVVNLSRKVLDFVRRKKTFKVYSYAQSRPYIHFYMYVENIRTKKGLRYDVDFPPGQNPRKGDVFGQPFQTFDGIIKAKPPKGKLLGKRFPVVRFSFLQEVLWHYSVIGTFDDQCELDYSIVGTNCLSWTVKATFKAILFARLPL